MADRAVSICGDGELMRGSHNTHRRTAQRFFHTKVGAGRGGPEHFHLAQSDACIARGYKVDDTPLQVARKSGRVDAVTTEADAPTAMHPRCTVVPPNRRGREESTTGGGGGIQKNGAAGVSGVSGVRGA